MYASQETAKSSSNPPPQQATNTPPANTVVYVSDFELDIQNAKQDKSSTSGTAPQPEVKKLDEPEQIAKRLQELMSTALVKELGKAGYRARRMAASDIRRNEGVQIRGIFAEVDEKNRLHRAVFGNDPAKTKLQLFVSVNNLASPEQPIYGIAEPQSTVPKMGVLITISPYAPVAKFELEKNATDAMIQKTASEIVSGLNTLLKANPSAVTQ
ncbi:MAG TPA: DUF4410 domain-containing protein [Candidatus Dormibacteraeota bacterium]|nr:DUF4410 domain-containing protein [Candidatus Dormibacteraeota bacterium]